jgi:REP element-mobilizing transposase RayT
MKYNPDIHKRRSIRLPQFDYSQKGIYFVTVCLQDRSCLFGQIVDDKMILNDAGKMVKSKWSGLSERFLNIELDNFIVMPNHFHVILFILENKQNKTVGASLVDAQNMNNMKNRAGTRPAPTLGDIIGAFKSITTIEYARNAVRNDWIPFRGKLWQRNYFERIIRNEKELIRI